MAKRQRNLTEIFTLKNPKSSVDSMDIDRESGVSVGNESRGDLSIKCSVDLRYPISAPAIDEVAIIILRHCM
jgi:hypothetical protein